MASDRKRKIGPNLKMAMDKRHRRVLQQNTTKLANDLDPLGILGYLYQEGILLEDQMERIKVEKTRKDQVVKLLGILPRRGAKAFDTFCDALYKIEGQRHLAKMLKEDIENSRGNIICSFCLTSWFIYRSVDDVHSVLSFGLNVEYILKDLLLSP